MFFSQHTHDWGVIEMGPCC